MGILANVSKLKLSGFAESEARIAESSVNVESAAETFRFVSIPSPFLS